MTKQKQLYRKNLLLIIAFVVLISGILIAALLITYGLTRKYVVSEFSARTIGVLERTMRPYNDLFQKKIPEINAYQGFLNKKSASEYADSVFSNYRFVKDIDFYHFTISNRKQAIGSSNKNIQIALTGVYNFKPGKSDTVKNSVNVAKDNDDFKMMSAKVNSYILSADTGRVYTSEDTYNTSYDVKPGKISYINIPRPEELKVYKQSLKGNAPLSVYQHDMMTFHLEKRRLLIKNTRPELYQRISIKQIIYDPLENDEGENLYTEIALPGAFSGYKLYFESSKSFITNEVVRRFLPIAAAVIVIYLFVILIGWLIFRNLNVNQKLFKLQYDFINNFTHEFKTPVSVIKIAGSNLRTAETALSERQQKHYGKILDEEADKLNNLMNRLLSFTQLENKSIQVKKEEIKLDDFVQKYINTFKIKYPHFTLTYQVHNECYFESDPVLLGSIFQNMIENAYKYSPPDRKELNIDVDCQRKDVVFLFADKGIGIPKAEIDNVFKKFYRIQSQYNQNGSVGLGLAFCKELVNFMNGEISVKSKVDQGSEFKIVLPY
ncbi:HAMP domain-containing histidine kinase [Mucilaginibacter sp. HMF5004]|uniref:sensor histidine kinase n=1 Tax=Mucilaginibacter rivuli TaxID=2857527 RepID=UPI001C5F019F|nr:HAMP domain-containing sensor histidine kinase [Mucilaginibacter rivuli]MBW4890265.1 HAMP domain-containing histidine kinase [Mucilaginibacter rivuli]